MNIQEEASLSPIHRIKSAGLSMGMWRKGWITSKSGSRLMITSARPSTAKFKNLLSLGSLHSAMEDRMSISSPRVAVSSSTATTSSRAMRALNFGRLITSSNSAKVAKEIKGWHFVKAWIKAWRDVPSFFRSALTTTPVSITARFTQESSSSNWLISFSERPLEATRLSMLLKTSSTDLGFAWAKKAASKAALSLRSLGNASKMDAMLSGRSRVTLFIIQIYKKIVGNPHGEV